MANSLFSSFDSMYNFRHRIAISLISGKQLIITNIHSQSSDKGLKDYELSFLTLIEAITKGTLIVINKNGTTLDFTPGVIDGGQFEPSCCLSRGIAYYLEPLFALAPFAKFPNSIILNGITNHPLDPSVDALKYSTLPLLKRFLGTDEGLFLKVEKRSVLPDGGGTVSFSCPTRSKLRSLNVIQPGKIKRIRGIAWSTRVSSSIVHQMVTSARAILNQFIPDVYIYTDACRAARCGKSAGFGLCLVAESTTEVFLSAEAMSSPRTPDGATAGGHNDPSEIGQRAASLLLDQISLGACVGTTEQSLALFLMALTPNDVSRLLTGPLTPHSVAFLRLVREQLALVYRLRSAPTASAEPDGAGEASSDAEEGDQEDGSRKAKRARSSCSSGASAGKTLLAASSPKLLVSCIGLGLSNIARAQL